VCTALAVFAISALPAEGQKITEVVADHAGSPDTYEYIEVAANPASVHPTGYSDTVLVNLSTYTLVELDGSSDPGKVLHVFPVGTTNGSGFWSTGYLTSTLEKPTFTILLVSGFVGAVGEDLDTGNDGVLDSAPWSAIADGVAFSDGSAGARTYAAPVLGPGFDGVATEPGGASRFPYYGDTDSVTDWKRNDFDGDGLPGFTGTLAAGEARNTPGNVTRVSVADYYAGIDATSQAALRSTIHARIANHIRYPYTSNSTDTWNILNLADQDPVDSGSILDIYKNATYTKIAGGTGAYNREHSWPNSYGFGGATATSEYTDCHHLFASDESWNSNRGNLPFGTCSAGCAENATLLNHGFGGGSGTYPGNSNWLGSVYEVWNHMRGDLARASLYMDVRYEGGPHPYTGTTETNLQLTDTLSQIVTGQPYMGLRSVLVAWSAADPPDDAERARNDVVESFQGNRNPFIDHPEWVSCVFQNIGCQVVSGPPTVTTTAATGISISAATLNASINPNGVDTTASFAWGLTTAYGQTTTPVAMGSGSSAVPLTANLTGLAACSTYHFRATATSTGGTSNGSDLSFSTSCPFPTVTTSAATGISISAATLNAGINPNGVDTTATFAWGLTTAYGQTTTPVAMGSGSSVVPLTANLTGLVACSTYHFRATATSTGGTSNGSDFSFSTSCPVPTVTTGAATGVTIAAATLNASINPNSLATNASFQWGLTTAYGQTTTPVAMGSGSSAVPLTANVTSLAACSTYHFRATASNSGGTRNGSDLSFSTACPSPTVTTGAVVGLTTTEATLGGTVNPNGVSTAASIEWGLTTSYGQMTTGQAMGAGSSALPLSAALTGLVPCTSYHFRATATSAGGTVTGSDASFLTTCSGGRLYTLAPCRVLDTRNDVAMTDGVPREVAFHGACGIPSTARALAANVTVTEPSLSGNVSIFPADGASTAATVVHFSAGRTRAATTILKLSDDGTGHARLEATVPTGGTTHVIVDVSGYFD
jgi:endonuclease I/uncharacterized OsmC-like protein